VPEEEIEEIGLRTAPTLFRRPPPSAPTAVAATPGEQSATVTWKEVTDLSITSFQVTAMPGGQMVTVGPGQTSALVGGLDDHKRYTFTVTAISAAGKAVSSPSAPVWPGDDVPGYLFPLQLLYVLVLVAAAFAYALSGSSVAHHTPQLAELARIRDVLPQGFAGVPLSIAWFGALGAVMVSFGAIFDHGHRDWRRGYDAWHISRPLLGAIMAMIGYLLLSGTLKAVGVSLDFTTAGTGRLIIFAIAFVIGFRESVFRKLVKQLADVLISPGLGGV
jgi:hypothetical protein